MRIPEQERRTFRSKPAARSDPGPPDVPTQTRHGFRSMVAEATRMFDGPLQISGVALPAVRQRDQGLLREGLAQVVVDPRVEAAPIVVLHAMRSACDDGNRPSAEGQFGRSDRDGRAATWEVFLERLYARCSTACYRMASWAAPAAVSRKG